MKRIGFLVLALVLIMGTMDMDTMDTDTMDTDTMGTMEWHFNQGVTESMNVNRDYFKT